MSRRFAHAEAESLLPEVEWRVRAAKSLKSQFDEAGSSMQRLAQKVTVMGGMELDRERVVRNATRRQQTAERLKAVLDRIEEVGCLIKDLDTGLVDFPTTYRGREVYLCWRLGEFGIQFWHGVDEGFAGRKAVDADFLGEHHGDPPN